MTAGTGRKKTNKWLLGCGIGCGILVFLMVGVAGTGVFYFGGVFSGLKDAMADRDALERAYGTRESYVPSPDGSIAPLRMEAFLQVRGALSETCTRFEATFGRLEAMDGKEDIDAGDLFGAMGAAFGIAPLMSEFFQARNRALLAAEMGLGEYTYIYILAYHSGAAPPVQERGRFDRVAREAFVGYLEHQSSRASAADQAALAKERAALAEDPERNPWQDGLPEPIRAALEPYRDRLEPLYCKAAAEVELARGEKRGLSFTTD